MTERKKPTAAQRALLTTVLNHNVRRFHIERRSLRGLDIEFFWAVDIGGQRGVELSERVANTCEQNGWIETVRPERSPSPSSFRDMIRGQTETSLRITDAGRAVIGQAGS